MAGAAALLGAVAAWFAAAVGGQHRDDTAYSGRWNVLFEQDANVPHLPSLVITSKDYHVVRSLCVLFLAEYFCKLANAPGLIREYEQIVRSQARLASPSIQPLGGRRRVVT
jgi:hypothetical protein